MNFKNLGGRKISWNRIGICPVCGGNLEITGLECLNCETRISGKFKTCEFCQLPPESIEFIRTFLKCRGNIKEVENELGISYPTVRNRLDSVLNLLGYKTTERKPSEGEILDSLSKGEISVEEALELLKKRR